MEQLYSIQFSLVPAHINISHNNKRVHLFYVQENGRSKTVLMNVRPQTLTVVNYELSLIFNSYGNI